MDFKYRTYSHAKTHLRYHIIFSTKFRRKCLERIRDEVMDAFRYAESTSRIRILVMECDKDHIHLLATFPPRYSVEQTVRRLKMVTTDWLYKKCEGHLRKYYWKNKRTLWTHGYFCSTIGEASEKTIYEYIKNQG